MVAPMNPPEPGPHLLGDARLSAGDVCGVAEQGREVHLTPEAWTLLFEEASGVSTAKVVTRS